MSARIANESQMNWKQYVNHATVRLFCQYCDTAHYNMFMALP